MFHNSWDYNDGRSEEIMGRALLNGYRKKAFLMTKIDGRTKEEAAKRIHEVHAAVQRGPNNTDGLAVIFDLPDMRTAQTQARHPLTRHSQLPIGHIFPMRQS